MLSTISILLAAAFASATPFARQADGDNGACAQQFATCKAAVAPTLQNVFSIESCLFAATCFGGQRPVDGFLASLFAAKTNQSTGIPASVNLPRVTSAVFDAISTDGATISQQNFIDGFYGQLSLTNGPWPTSPAPVISYYQRVAVWTAFCTSPIPFKNFGDYFQYSSTVDSPGCTNTTTPPPPPPPPPVSSDATCQKMFDTCTGEVESTLANVFAVEPCVFAATCFGGQRPVAGLVATVFEAKNNGSSAYPAPANLARLSPTVFDAISTDGATWTQQNFIDGWYGELSAVGGPFPPNADLVISYFDRILLWSGFCIGQGIPYKNVADYFQYASTVSGPTTQC